MESLNEEKWFNVKLSTEYITFISTYRTRLKEEFNVSITKDQVLRTILAYGIESIDYDLLNNDPMSFLQGPNNSREEG
jgi:hypothetical protein